MSDTQKLQQRIEHLEKRCDLYERELLSIRKELIELSGADIQLMLRHIETQRKLKTTN